MSVKHLNMILLCFFIFAILAGIGKVRADESDETSLEKYVCLAEGAFISFAKASIINPKAKADFSIPGLEKDEFTAKDSRNMRGLYWKADPAKGYVLIVQGTSMLAAEIYERFKEFNELGFDVYIYDFRGYGRSDGNTAFQGIISDYTQVIQRLNANPRYKHRYFYGISFGGVVLLNAIGGDHSLYDGMIFDSVPDGIFWYVFCDTKYDPDQLMPADANSCRNWLIIAGGNDGVIRGRAVDFATDAKNQCGAILFIKHHYGHIFMDNAVNTKERLTAAKRFLIDLMSKEGMNR